MYSLNETKITNEDGKEQYTYGITVGKRRIEDISINKAKVEKLVGLCNLHELSELHIDDVVEDFLVDFEI